MHNWLTLLYIWNRQNIVHQTLLEYEIKTKLEKHIHSLNQGSVHVSLAARSYLRLCDPRGL